LTIGRELGVHYVLEGEIQRSGNRVRVTAQLIDAEKDQRSAGHCWPRARASGSMFDVDAYIVDQRTAQVAVN